LQRWINPDPAGDEDGPNRYKMVSNNPINLIDRFGLQGEQSFVSGLLEASVLASALVAVGFALGSVADYGDEGAVVGAAVGALFLGRVLEDWWLAYQQARPEVIAAKKEQLADSRNMQLFQYAAEKGLTHEETVNFSAFALKEFEAQGGNGTFFEITRTEAGGIYGYVGPASNRKQAKKVLNNDNNPVRGMKVLGYKVLLLRNLPSEQSSTPSGGGIAGQFDSVNPVAVSGQRKERGTSQPGPSVIQPHSAEPAPAQKMIINTEKLSSLLQNVSEYDEQVVQLTIDKLLDGRLKANHLKGRKGEENRFAADLPGYMGGRRRGTHRLMLSHQGGLHYRVEDIKKTH
jgi:insecticidal toxin complex protein TccC